MQLHKTSYSVYTYVRATPYQTYCRSPSLPSPRSRSLPSSLPRSLFSLTRGTTAALPVPGGTRRRAKRWLKGGSDKPGSADTCLRDPSLSESLESLSELLLPEDEDESLLRVDLESLDRDRRLLLLLDFFERCLLFRLFFESCRGRGEGSVLSCTLNWAG